MKKNIVVLVSEIANDYSFSVLDGIYSYFSDKDVNLITIPTRRGNQLSAKHYWIGMKLAEAEQVDGVIVLSAIYLSAITKEELAKDLSHFHILQSFLLKAPPTLMLPATVPTTQS